MTDLAAWLEQKGLGQYAALFEREKLTLKLLAHVTDENLRELGIPLGHRLVILEGARADLASLAVKAQSRPPDHLTSARGDADRRPLTVVFCDLADSIPISRHFGPEEFRSFLKTYRAVCSEPLRRYGGFTARYVGDGILMYFGYPVAHENDAERALYASLEIRQGIADLDLKTRERSGPKIAVHIGIASGEVVVGDIVGGDAAEAAAVTGEAPNLAARLQSLAPAGSILIDQMTRDLVGEQFEYHFLGEKNLKGFDNPVSVWEVVGERPFTRYESRRGRRSRLVGRASQLASLSKQWTAACSGHGQVALIYGRAGIGKSRLADATRAQAAKEANQKGLATPLTIRLQCSQLHTNTPLFPVSRAIERLAGFSRADNTTAKLTKLQALIDRSGLKDKDHSVPLLADMMGLHSIEGALTASMGARELRMQRMVMLRSWIKTAARSQPLLLLIEDIQWIDPSFQELLRQLVGEISDVPILIVATLRSGENTGEGVTVGVEEGLANWRAIPVVERYDLDELSDEDGTQLILEIAGTRTVPPSVIRTVLSRALGNPLYIEELTRGWLETNPADRSIATLTHRDDLARLHIPTSLSSALMERIDQTGPAKDIALHAAVIGNEFSTDLLERISSESEVDVQTSLRLLEHAGIIKPVMGATEATFRFSHALIQSAAYTSLLTNRRKDIHWQIASALEHDRANNADVSLELIAQHFARNHSAEKAIRLWQEAAEQAAVRSAHQEAARLLDNALNVLRDLPHSLERLRLELDLTAASATALRSLHGYAAPVVEECYLRAQELCGQVDAPQMGFYVDWGLFQCYLVKDEILNAGEHAQNLMLNVNLTSSVLRADAYLAVGMVHLQNGEFESARHFLEQSVAMTEPTHDTPNLLTHGQSPGVFCRSQLAYTLAFLGFADRAKDIAAENLQTARARQSDPALHHTYISSLAFSARIYWHLRETNAVYQAANELLEIARRYGYLYYECIGQVLLGWCATQQGKSEDGIEAMLEGIYRLEETGTKLGARGFWISLTDECVKARNAELAHRALERASSDRDLGARIWDAELERVSSLVDLLAGPDAYPTAEAKLRSGLEIARSQRARELELRCAISLAHLLREVGRSSEARDLLVASASRCAQHGITNDVLEAKKIILEIEGGN